MVELTVVEQLKHFKTFMFQRVVQF